MATVRYFAAAAEAMGVDAEPVSGASVAQVMAALERRHGSHVRDVWSRCTVLVDGQRATDEQAQVSADATIDVLPPFAGG